MELVEHNPAEGIYAPVGGEYSHAVEVRDPTRFLYTSGTMGLDPAGVAGQDIKAQIALVWDNLRRLLASADMTVDNVVRVVQYIRDPDYDEPVTRARVEALGGRLVPTIMMCAQTLVPEWLVEVEIVAAA
ncbi:MAG: enamine deaminase RidA [Catenulispora sp. 13_1_20CM_3_70_7]|nr:RidA family protein [Catenulisporales bacterium]OLE27104.1 MAG: enamine deaminase RidA [Catenulispora sp. 13_1_20CM_3_70_7]